MRQTPVEVKANFLFDEKITSQGAGKVDSVRYYREADAKIKLGENAFEAQLGDNQALIGVAARVDGVTLFCPHGPLTRDQLELLDVQGGSTVLAALLPEEEKEVKEEWEVGVAALVPLLRLDAIVKSNVTAQLIEVKDGAAVVSVNGPVSGMIDGIATEITLKGKLSVDLEKETVAWLVLSINETRSIGHAQPGFETKTLVRMATLAAKTPPELTVDVLDKLVLTPTASGQLLKFTSPSGKFRLQHERQWRMMTEAANVTIFRMVDKGDLVAQLDVAALPPLEAGRQLSLEEFTASTQRTIGPSFQQIVEASQAETESGLRVLRVTAVGMVDKLPIQWICCHFSDADGRRASYAFTLEASLSDRFGGADQTLINSLQLLSPQPSVKTARKP
ncbi:hypothetical protein [Lignipirellula cremea]|uniref:hypothetical protein n=1 Tax=Lignipirellula cremea TaxID=2528010 RepID=UPI0011A5096C|nr:hypothetical protein [Lignipirellula cremea]